MKALTIILLSLMAVNLVTAQKQAKIDSLNKVLETGISERGRVDTYNTIAYEYRKKDSLKVAQYANKAIQLSEKINYPEGIVDAYCRIASATRRKGNYAKAKQLYKKAVQVAQTAKYREGEGYAVNGIGMTLYMQGNYPEARKYYQNALEIREEIGDKRGVGSSLNNIGVIYERQGNDSKAIEYYFKALTIREEIGDKSKTASTYHNLGIVYRNEGNYSQALEYHFKALKVHEAIGKIGSIASNYNNIGLIYKYQGNYSEALKYFQKALKIREASGKKGAIAMTYDYIGEIYIKLKEYTIAQRYLKHSLDLCNKISSKTVMVSPLLNLGKLYIAQEKYTQAIPYLEEAIQTAQAIGINDIVRDGAEQLALAYESAGRFEEAYGAYKLFKTMADSLKNEESTKKVISQTMQYEFDKKEAKSKAEQQKKDLEKEQELQIQKYYTYTSIGGGLALLAIALLIYRGQQKQKKANQLLEQQKKEIALQAEELTTANERLQELDKIKNRFFSNISHELRTPLTLILGSLDKFKRKNSADFPPELSSAKKHASLLHQLINQLLDITKLEAGKMELNLTAQPLVGLLKSYLQSFEALAYEKSIRLKFNSNQEKCYALIDKQAFEKIVYNLLSNAYKFTPEHGSITLGVNVHNAELMLLVSDTGIGISEKERPLIFDRFYQVDTSMQRNYEGTGIGLSLVKELVELHEGTIEVSSVVGKGTTFTLRIPIQVIEKPKSDVSSALIEESLIHHEMYETSTVQESHELEQDSTKPIVLIIEDHLDLQQLIAEELVDHYRVLTASNGQEGLEVALEEIPDLIISDVMMPYKNGYELCEVLKTDERTSHIPIILLTARTAQENKIQGLEVGADDYISKPFDSEELTIRTKNLINNRTLLREKFSQQGVSDQFTKELAQNATEQSFLDKLLSLLEDNFADEQYDVSQMAEALNMSKRQLHRKLKAIADQTPSKMLQSFRLEKAKLLLLNPELQVKEVGFMVGFASQPYFNYCFKKQYGITPNTFRTTL